MNASGGRYELRREAQSDVIAYAGSFSTPTASWRARFDVNLENGAVRESFAADSAPPEWLLAHARAVLRGLWRAHGAELRAWPPRVTRWRPEALATVTEGTSQAGSSDAVE